MRLGERSAGAQRVSGRPSLGVGAKSPAKNFEILHANQSILVLFGVICVGQQCRAKIMEGRKDTLASQQHLYWRGQLTMTDVAATDEFLSDTA